MTKFNLEKCKSGNKGITLIALVITIIVLLILAGVTIAQLTGSDSAPAKANEAKQKNDIGAAKDEVAIFVQNELTKAYEEQYVNGAAGGASGRIGTAVINAVNRKYETTLQRGLANIKSETNSDGNGEVTIWTTDFKVIGTIDKNGGILTWGEIGQNDGIVTGNWEGLSAEEKGKLAKNNMAELTVAQINADTSLTDEQKVALQDETKIKAVLTGNIPVPVGYTYEGGTGTAATSAGENGWGVVLKDGDDNEWVWVPVNAEESKAPSDVFEDITENNKMGKVVQGPQKDVVAEEKKMPEIAYAGKLNGMKLASLNGLEGIKFGPKVADSGSGSGSSGISYTIHYYKDGSEVEYEERTADGEFNLDDSWIDDSNNIDKNKYDGYEFDYVKEKDSTILSGNSISVYYLSGDAKAAKDTTVGTKTKGGILSGITRGNPTDTSSYREPALVTSYDLQEQYYKQAGFISATQMAQAFKKDYEDMVASIKKYGGFYVGRYELSGSVENPTVQANQDVKNSTNWYQLYKACRGLGKESTTSTMMWGAQWDLMCLWSQKKGNTISYSQFDSSRHTGILAKAGKNSADKRNNIYDVEGNCYEWTQEADSTSRRAIRGGYFKDTNFSASYRNSYGYLNSGYNNYSSRPSLYIK